MGKVAPGTADMSLVLAMTPAQAHQALALGVRVAQEEIARAGSAGVRRDGHRRGTPPATAIVATFTGRVRRGERGPGTGLASPVCVSRPMSAHRPQPGG